MPSNPVLSSPLGWPLLPQPDPSGQLAFPGLEESIRDQIRVILLTRPGEQLMRPDFGAGLEEFVGEQDTVETRRRIRDRIQRALESWETRILLDGVEVYSSDADPGQVRAEILYRLRRTGAARRIGLTVDLNG